MKARFVEATRERIQQDGETTRERHIASGAFSRMLSILSILSNVSGVRNWVRGGGRLGKENEEGKRGRRQPDGQSAADVQGTRPSV